MDGLIKLAASVLTARRALDRVGVVARNGAAALALAAVALVLLVAALGCAVAALWLYALPLLGPIWTAATAAALFLILALILLFLARRLMRRPARPAAPGLDVAAAAALGELVAKHKGAIVLAGLVAGLIAGKQNRL